MIVKRIVIPDINDNIIMWRANSGWFVLASESKNRA